MSKEILNPSELAPPRGFNHGVLVSDEDILFLAGQDGADSDENIVASDDLVAQFEQVLENLQVVVQEAGGSMDDIVKLNVFVDNRGDYIDNLDSLGEVFSSYFDEYPTMALFEVSAFFKEDALVEMEGFAAVESE